MFTASWLFSDIAVSSPFLNFNEEENQDWVLGLIAEVYSWSQQGSLVNNVDYSKYVQGSFVASGDSLNLPRATSPALTLSAGRQGWNFGVYYMQVDFEGSGTGLAVVTGDSIGGFVTQPVDANMSVDFLLARVSYNLIDTDTSVFSLGIGIGQVDIDMLLTTEDSLDFIYRDRQPYGYLSIDMANRHEWFYYGFSLNTFKVHAGEVEEDHIDYRIDLGFRVHNGSVPVDVMVGWRHLDIQFEIENTDSETVADFDISGPYLGLSISY